jgi:MFS family permease
VRAVVPAVLREEPQFRRLFLGQALSLVGDRVTTVVLPFAVLASGGGATEVGLVAAAQFVPFLAFGLVAGVAADRTDRRRILVLSDLVRCATQAVAAVLLLSGDASPAALAALAAVFGTADAFFAPAVTGLLPQTLGSPGRLQDANALRGLTMSAGHVAGPALAGVLVATVGAGGALAFDALTFAVSVLFLLRLRPRAVERLVEAGESLLAGLRGGWHAVRSRRWVWSFLLAMSGYHVIVLPAVFVLGPVLAAREYGGATDWAIVVAAFGAGAVLGDLLLLRWRPRLALRASALCLLVASLQAVFIGSGLPILAIAGLELVAGVFVTGFFVLWETSLQEHVPEHELSRVSSYDYTASTGLLPLGFAIAGPASVAFGIHATLAAMSALGVASALALLAVRAVRELPRADVPAR